MSKKIKIIIPLIIILLLLLAGGTFYWWQWKKEEVSMKGAFEFGVLPKGFVTQETSEGIVLENKDIGISFRVPNGWKFTGYLGDSISLTSPDYEYNPELFKHFKGCAITVRLDHYSYSNRIERINEIKNGFTSPSEGEEVMMVSGYDALKRVEKSEQFQKEGIEKNIQIEIPFPKVAINFLTSILETEKTRCNQAFDEFFKTVSINYHFDEAEKWSKREDFLIENIQGEEWVKNQRGNFSFRAPPRWRAVTEGYQDQGRVGLYNPDYLESFSTESKKGCFIKNEAIYDKDYFNKINTEIKQNKSLEEDFRKVEIINVGNYQAVKEVINNQETGVKIVRIHLPVKDEMVIFFGSAFYPDYYTECSQDFNYLLSTLSIK